MKAVVKSIAASLFATCLASFFLLMLTMGAMGVMGHLRTGDQYAELHPSVFMRAVGLPLAGVMFVVFFALAMRRFRRPEGRP